MKEKKGKLINYREKERSIRTLTKKLAKEKRFLINKRQECNHAVLVLLDYRELTVEQKKISLVPSYKCLLCGQEVLTQDINLSKRARVPKVEQENGKASIVIDATRYGTSQMDIEDKMAEIEQLYIMAINDQEKTETEQLKNFLDIYQQDCSFFKKLSSG